MVHLAVVVAAAGRVPGEADTPVARLEQRLSEQQERIGQLQQQLAAAAQPDVNDARTEALKQQIREVLREREFREGLMPAVLQAGYDEGFFIRSSDDKFRLTINGYVQFRWTHYATRSENRDQSPGFRRHDRTGFDVQRWRLIFSGHAYSPDLTYFLELLADAPDAYDVNMLYGWVEYRVADEFHVMAGLLALPSTRASHVDERGFQFIDTGLVDQVFGLGDGVGVQFWGHLLNRKLDYYLAVSNALNGPTNRTITTDEERELDGNPALTFRTVWHALGEDPTAGLFEGDVEHVESPVLDIGFHYAFNRDDGDLETTEIPYPRRPSFRPGGFGVTNSNGLQIHQFGLDAAFKYRGFSITGDYVLRLLDVKWGNRPPFAPLFLLTGDDSTNAQHGASVQAGYFLPIPGLEKKLEVVARAGGISTLAGGREGTWEYAGGLNYYIQGHQVKLQTDVTKVSEAPITTSYGSLANVNDDALVWRVQLQVAF